MLASDGLTENTWIKDIHAGYVTVEVCSQRIQVWEALEGVERDVNIPNQFIWKGSRTGVYTTKGTYMMLCQGMMIDDMHKMVWKSFAPLKCKIFIWQALRYMLWTADRRFRHGLEEHTKPATLACSRRTRWITS
jgi:hypothetical protein